VYFPLTVQLKKTNDKPLDFEAPYFQTYPLSHLGCASQEFEVVCNPHRINLFSNEYMSLVATHLLTGMQPPKLMSCCRDSNPHFLDFVLPGFRILRFWVQRVLVSSVWSLLWKMYEHFEHQKHWRYAGIWDCQRILTHITLLKYMTWHDMTWHYIALHYITYIVHTVYVCMYTYTYIYIYIYNYIHIQILSLTV